MHVSYMCVCVCSICLCFSLWQSLVLWRTACKPPKRALTMRTAANQFQSHQKFTYTTKQPRTHTHTQVSICVSVCQGKRCFLRLYMCVSAPALVSEIQIQIHMPVAIMAFYHIDISQFVVVGSFLALACWCCCCRHRFYCRLPRLTPQSHDLPSPCLR